jgi:hypothetical protein
LPHETPHEPQFDALVFGSVSQPFDGFPSHSRRPVPHATHEPLVQVWVCGVHVVVVLHCPLDEHV